jgi:hypothetical protein
MRRIGALLVGNDLFFYSRREQSLWRRATRSRPSMLSVNMLKQAG